MPTRTNADLEKARLHAKIDARLSESTASLRGSQVCTQADVDDDFAEVAALDSQRRANRVYDAGTLRAGTMIMVIGALALLVAMMAGIGGVYYPGTPQWASSAVGFLALMGSWAMIAGWRTRTAPNLPFVIQPSDIERCLDLLDAIDQRYRPLTTSFQRQVALLLLTLESALLLSLVLPIIGDSLSPNAQAAMIVPGALVLGLLQARLINRLAYSLAVLRLRHKEYRLRRQTEFPDAQRKAAMIRVVFGDITAQQWDRPGLSDYRVPIAWGVVAVAVIAVLCSVRLFASEHGVLEGIVALVLAVAAGSLFAVAVAAEAHGIVLVPDVAEAQRVVARFASSSAFVREMRAQDAGFEAQLMRYRRGVRLGYYDANQSTVPGVPKALELDFSGRQGLSSDATDGRLPADEDSPIGSKLHAIPAKGA